MTSYIFSFRFALSFILCLCFSSFLSAADITVNPGDNLQTAINNASCGDIITINGGNYGGIITVQNKNCTLASPLIIKAGSATPVLTGTGNYNQGDPSLDIAGCSYLAIDGLKITNSMYGCYMADSDHVIMTNCEVTATGQEGIHCYNDVDYIDIINNEIHHTGNRVDHEGWGEGIYIGGGDPQVDNSYIYIEGNTIYECGLGEGINIKSNTAEKVTIKNNYLHDIHPGKTGINAQWNGGAIGVSASSTPADREIWIEENVIENIYGGETSNTGIMTMNVGTRIVNNTISNCDDNAIMFNGYLASHPCWHFGNTMINNGAMVTIASPSVVNNANPGLSPYQPQTWYNNTTVVNPPPPPPTGTNIALNKPVIASSEQSGSEGSKAVDGSFTDIDRWSAEFFPQSLEINLQGNYDLDVIEVFPLYNRAYQYTVEAKMDGGSYQQIIDRSNNSTLASVFSDALSNVEADWVKFTFTGAAVYAGDWLSIIEIRIFGTPATNSPAPGGPLLESEGDIYISDISSGVIMIAPNGDCFRMKINNSGQWVSEAIACPN